MFSWGTPAWGWWASGDHQGNPAGNTQQKLTVSVTSLRLPWLGCTPRMTMVCSRYWRRDYNIQFKEIGNSKRGKKKILHYF